MQTGWLQATMQTPSLVMSNKLYPNHFSHSGTYTYTTDDDINGRPIYRTDRHTRVFAVKTVSEGFLASWVLASEPGGSSGLIFGDYTNPKCPHAVALWSFFSQSTGQITEDPTLKVACASGRSFINYTFIN